MPTSDATRDVFHKGEFVVQERADSVAPGRNSGRTIASGITPVAVTFAGLPPFLLTGRVDKHNNLWASIVIGRSGVVANLES